MRSRLVDDTSKLWMVSCIIFAIGGLGAGTLGVVWIYIEADFDVTLSALGAMLTAATIGRTITSMISGPIIGRFGIGWVMMGGAFIGIFSQLSLALSLSWPMFMVAAVGHGFGSGVMGVGLNAFGAVHFSARRMNWLHGSYGIGSTIGPFLVTTIVIDLAIDWRWIYALFAGTRVLMFVVFYLTRDRWRIGEGDKEWRRERATPACGRLCACPSCGCWRGAWLMATGNETGRWSVCQQLSDWRALD